MARLTMLERIEKDWARFAGGEAIEVEEIRGAFYGFTSELGALRLYQKFVQSGAPTDRIRADYSKNLGSWFFRIEVDK